MFLPSGPPVYFHIAVGLVGFALQEGLGVTWVHTDRHSVPVVRDTIPWSRFTALSKEAFKVLGNF